MKKALIAAVAALALALPVAASATPGHGAGYMHKTDATATTAATATTTGPGQGFIVDNNGLIVYVATQVGANEFYSAGCEFTPMGGGVGFNVGESAQPSDANGSAVFYIGTDFMTHGQTGTLDCWAVEGSVNPWSAPRLAETTFFVVPA